MAILQMWPQNRGLRNSISFNGRTYSSIPSWQTLTASAGTWTNSPASFAYQWKSAGVNATGAGAATANYTAATADIGKTLAVSVTAPSSGGSIAPATSAATAAVT
jgi:hypothetical protein